MQPAPHISGSFMDLVSGKLISYYTDCYGRNWMATSRWAWFRVPVGYHTKDKPRVWRSAQ